jgi:hypothetical protein
VARGDEIGIERGEPFEQRAVFDVLVAAHAGVRSTARGIVADKGIDDMCPELVFEVHHVVPDAELPGDAPGVVDVFDAAALLVAAELFGAGLRPEAHGDTHDVVALL